jgi:hypothetical protein
LIITVRRREVDLSIRIVGVLKRFVKRSAALCEAQATMNTPGEREISTQGLSAIVWHARLLRSVGVYWHGVVAKCAVEGLLTADENAQLDAAA